MRRVVIGGLLIGLLALAWYVDSLLGGSSRNGKNRTLSFGKHS